MAPTGWIPTERYRSKEGLGVWEHRGKVAATGFGPAPIARRWDESLETSLGALTIDAVEYYDKTLDLTAMEKWTGWHIAIMALEIAYNRVEKGAISVENALKGQTFLEEARKRNYDINIDMKEY